MSNPFDDISRPTQRSQNKRNLALQAAALDQSKRIVQSYVSAKSWDDIGNLTGITIPATYRELPFDRFNVIMFANWWKESWSDRLISETRENASITAADVKDEIKIYLDSLELEQRAIIPGWKFKPQQRKAIYSSIALYRDGKYNAALVPLRTGRGKSIIAAALFRWVKDQQYFGEDVSFRLNPPMLYLTPKPVVIKTKRTFERFGVHADDCMVTHYQALSSAHWKPFFREVHGELYGNAYTFYEYRDAAFVMIGIDECQKLKKIRSKMTRKVDGFLRARGAERTKWLFTSATPGICVNDFYMFGVASNARFSGSRIDRSSWPAFARYITDKPDKPNNAAVDKLKDYFADSIICPPEDPRSIKVVNSISLCDFINEQSRQRYASAEQRYIESLEKIGKDGSKLSYGAIFTIFRAAEEREKCPVFVDRAMQAVRDGRSAIIGICFQDSLIDIVGELISRGVSRDKISIIWGGRKIFTSADVYTQEEFGQVTDQMISNPDLQLDPKVMAKYRKTMRYYQDEVRREETPEEHEARLARLKGIRLDAQTDEERQDEIDRFQNGETDYCIFTFAAGGTGLDLDHSNERSKPRSVFVTVCYYAEEFIQALGRADRISTISDVEQYMLFFAGSVAADHVAPKLAKKISAINKLSASGVDFSLLLERAVRDKAEKERIENTAVEAEELTEDVVEDDDENGDGKDEEKE